MKTFVDRTYQQEGDRFVNLSIREITGCSFEEYLRRPDYFEAIARSRRLLAQERLRNALRRAA